MSFYDVSTKEQLSAAMDALIAGYHGCVSSGSTDTELKELVSKRLKELAEDGRAECSQTSKKFDRFIRDYLWDYYLCDKALDCGYGLEDVISFFRWLGDEMGFEW